LGPVQKGYQSNIRWAIIAFKLAGIQEVVPVFLQHRTQHFALHLCLIFRICLTYGYIIGTWRQVTVAFIPKPGKINYTKEEAYYQTSFFYYVLRDNPLY
jgi:hypothetical protein